MSPETGPRGLQRLHALDAARGLAMLLVVAGHTLLSFMETPIGWAIQDQSRCIAADLGVWIGHAFLMPTFFLLAGFFAHLTIAKIGLVGFARQRLQRVLAPLLILIVPMSLAMNALWDWGKALTQGARAAAPVSVSALRPSELPVTLSHLWYLYYLLIVSAFAATLVMVCRRAPLNWQTRAQTWSRRAVGAAWLPMLMAVPTAVILGMAGKLQLDTPLTLVVDPWIAGFYGLFFFIGWMFHVHVEQLPSQARRLWFYLALAIGCLLWLIPGLSRSAAPDPISRPSVLALYLSAAFTWLCTVSFLALCLRFLSRPRRWLRFVADASYWCYVTHLPLVVLLQIAARHLRLPGPIKLTIILSCTLATCLLTYRYLVKNTFVGRYLG